MRFTDMAKAEHRRVQAKPCTVSKPRKEVIIMKNFRSAIAVILAIVMSMSCIGCFGVSAASKKVHLNKTTLSAKIGQIYQLKLVNNKKKVTWKSSNKKIVSVDKKGRIYGQKPGKAVVSAKVGKKTYKCSVKVSYKKNKISAVYLDGGYGYDSFGYQCINIRVSIHNGFSGDFTNIRPSITLSDEYGIIASANFNVVRNLDGTVATIKPNGTITYTFTFNNDTIQRFTADFSKPITYNISFYQ